MLTLLQRPDCDFAVGPQTMRFNLPSRRLALEFARHKTDAIVRILAQWGLKEALIDYPGCPCAISVPSDFSDSTESLLEPLEEPFMLKGLVTDDWLRLAEEINNEDRPTFLVSMLRHKNVLVNTAACQMMGCSDEELLRRDLAPLWVPPGELKPISYSIQLPPHLDEMHGLLRQQTELLSHSFSNWKPAGDSSDAIWTVWNDDIKFVEVEGHPYRLMRVNGFDEVRA